MPSRRTVGVGASIGRTPFNNNNNNNNNDTINIIIFSNDQNIHSAGC